MHFSKLLYASSAKVLCLLLIGLLSCQKGSEEVAPPKSTVTSLNYDEPTLQWILSLGHKADKIIDKGSYYIVEGDIKYKKITSSSNGRQVLNPGPNLVDYTKISNITVGVGTNYTTSTWRQTVIDATQDAINSWNNVGIVSVGNRVHMSYTTGSADVVVDYDPTMGIGNYGLADSPSGCNPGHDITINSQTEFATRTQLHWAIAHELGHTIGFGHTDFGANILSDYILPDTPTTEANSVMNSADAWGLTTQITSLPNWPGFTFGDRQAVEDVYASTPITDVNYVGTNASGRKTYRFKWTAAYFCLSEVRVTWAYIPCGTCSGMVICNNLAPNRGVYLSCPANYGAGTYKYTVLDPNNITYKLEKTFIVP